LWGLYWQQAIYLKQKTMTPSDTIHCTNPGHCKNHPVVQVIDMPIIADTVAAIEANTVAVDIVSPIVNKVIHKSIDTIRPADVSLISEYTYSPVIIHQVRNQPEIKQPMNFDLLINSLLFSFMLVLSAKYVLTCGPCWASLFRELKQELS
jgi:hypothetical protein